MTEHTVSYKSFRDNERPNDLWFKCTCGIGSSVMTIDECHAAAKRHLARHDAPKVNAVIHVRDIDPVQADKHLKQRVDRLMQGWPGHVKIELDGPVRGFDT